MPSLSRESTSAQDHQKTELSPTALAICLLGDLITNTSDTKGSEHDDEDHEDEEHHQDEEVDENHEHGSCNSCCGHEEDEDELADFRSVLAVLSLENLPKLASTLRHQQDTEDAELIDCVVNDTPLTDVFNLFYTVEFADGVKWGLRVPSIGTADNFDEISARSMENEVMTMRLLKRKTTIPVPTIYGYSVTTENELNCPYIIMELVEGTLLQDKWVDKSIPEVEMEAIRARALQEIAEAMMQLSQFRFDQGGALLFDESGNPAGVGPMKVFDLDPFEEGYGSVHELGPFSNPISAVTVKLDVQIAPSNETTIGFRALLRLLLSWIPQCPDPKFVLHHPNFDIQNFIVGDDGSLGAIIDWEGVCTVPRWIGNESYPVFLTREPYVPYVEDDVENEEDIVSIGRCADEEEQQNTIKDFERYRAMYLEFIKACKARSRTESAPSVSVTKNSKLLYNLAVNGTNPFRTTETLIEIFADVIKAVADDTRRPISTYEKQTILFEMEMVQSDLDYQLMVWFGQGLVAGTLSEDDMGWLRDGFAALFSDE